MQVHTAPLAPQEFPERREKVDSQDQVAPLELQDHLAPLEIQVPLVYLESLDHLDKLVLQDLLGHKDLPDLPVMTEMMERMVFQAHQENKDLLGHLDQSDHLEIQGSLVHQGLLEISVPKDKEERRDRMVHLVPVEYKVLQEHRVLLALLVHQDLLDLQEQLVQMALLVMTDLLEKLDHLGHQDRLGLVVNRERRENKEHEVIREKTERLEYLVTQEQ